MLTLAADEIVMGPHAVLGPVDPQLGQYPAASILKVVEQKPIAEIDDETLILADQARKALRQVGGWFARSSISTCRLSRPTAWRSWLTNGTWTHDYPIMVSEARELGLTVSTDMPMEVYELMQLYPQTAQRRPAVEYVPLPYGLRRSEARRSDAARRAGRP